jgi:hypothetical protein
MNSSFHVTPAIIETTSEGSSLIPLTQDPTDTTFPLLVAALGGEEAFAALPELDLGDKCGSTGYLDFLRPEDMTAPVMRGSDKYGRPFVAFRMERKAQVQVEVVFRRYTTGSTWTSGGGCILCTGALTAEDLLFIKRLAAGEQVGMRAGASYKVGCMDDWSIHNEAEVEDAKGKHRRVVVEEPDEYGWVRATWERGQLRLV